MTIIISGQDARTSQPLSFQVSWVDALTDLISHDNFYPLFCVVILPIIFNMILGIFHREHFGQITLICMTRVNAALMLLEASVSNGPWYV